MPDFVAILLTVLACVGVVLGGEAVLAVIRRIRRRRMHPARRAVQDAARLSRRMGNPGRSGTGAGGGWWTYSANSHLQD
jgi:hypothetical protein